MQLKSLLIFFIAFGIIMIGLYFFLYKSNLNKKYILTESEKEILDYFIDVALNTEYEDNPQRVVKWNETMFLYIYKDGLYREQINTIEKTILNINKLVQNDFRIELTNSFSKSNAVLYLCEKSTMNELNLPFMECIDEEYAGLTSVQFSWDDYTIRKAEIFIDTEESSEIQFSAILEELTQSIGLMNDSEKHKNSIFYKHQIENNLIKNDYAEIDVELIKLLYHPKMKSGMDSIQCSKIISSIFAQSKF